MGHAYNGKRYRRKRDAAVVNLQPAVEKALLHESPWEYQEESYPRMSSLLRVGTSTQLAREGLAEGGTVIPAETKLEHVMKVIEGQTDSTDLTLVATDCELPDAAEKVFQRVASAYDTLDGLAAITIEDAPASPEPTPDYIQ